MMNLFMLVLAALLAILQLAHVIDISWWIILAPLWIPCALSALLIALACMIGAFHS